MGEELDKDLPPCDIKIDKDGVWYFRGAEMFRKDIIRILCQNLKRDKSGRYIIEMRDEKCYLEVEDTPFVVTSVNRFVEESRGREEWQILLSDGSAELLDPATLRMNNQNVMYCSVKGGNFEARFSRAGYYQLAEWIEYDNENDTFFISQGNERYIIACNQS
ncbi:MAG: DUF1285 domain-containing protein [Syntrophales bacterium]